MNSLLHPDGPASSRRGLSESYYDGRDSFEVSVESLSVAEEDDSTATVEAAYTTTRQSDGNTNTASYDQNIVLETYEGNWRIYSFQ